MPLFAHEQTASLSLGNTCATCATHKHERGFVNLGIDRLNTGRLYLCAGCVDEIGRLVGHLDPRQAQELRDIADELGEGADKLRDELAEAKDNRVVALADVIDLVAERAKRSAKAPAKVGA